MIDKSKYKKELLKKYGIINIDVFHDIWDLFYTYEKGISVEDELKKIIKETFPDKNQEKFYEFILKQFEEARIERRFFYRKNTAGYGFEVLERVKDKHKLLFHTYEEEKAKDYCKSLLKDSNAKAPSTSGEIPPTKILFINDHFGPIFFKVDTIEEFKKKTSEFIISKIKDGEYYYNPEIGQKSENIIKEFVILEKTDNKLSEILENEFTRIKKVHESNIIHDKTWSKAWKIAEKIVELRENSEINDIFDVLNHFQGSKHEGCWNIIEPK